MSDNVRIGVVKPPQKDPRIYTPKEVRKHKESNAGKSTIGITIDY